MSRGPVTYDAQLRLTLESELLDKLTAMAGFCGESRNEFIRQAVRERIKKRAPKSPSSASNGVHQSQASLSD